jgi:hypothetical protein
MGGRVARLTPMIGESMRYSNEAILEALKRAQFRQVPWAKKPRVFEFLRSAGLLGTERQRLAAPTGYHAPVDIAVLTELGKLEVARLAEIERTMEWESVGADEYTEPSNPMHAVLAALTSLPGMAAPQGLSLPDGA